MWADWYPMNIASNVIRKPVCKKFHNIIPSIHKRRLFDLRSTSGSLPVLLAPYSPENNTRKQRGGMSDIVQKNSE